MSSQQTQRKIIIIGGTGKQGSAVINALLSSKSAPSLHLLTLTRNPQSKKALELKERGVELVQTDLDKVTVDELAKVLEGEFVFSSYKFKRTLLATFSFNPQVPMVSSSHKPFLTQKWNKDVKSSMQLKNQVLNRLSTQGELQTWSCYVLSHLNELFFLLAI
jgi:hypothetical protein